MATKSKSQYFDRIEEYLRQANGPKSLQALEELTKVVGTPAEMVDSIVNGALADFIYDCVPPKNDFVQIYDNEGNAIYQQKKEMSFSQWVDAITNTIIGIKKDRIEGILQKMYDKGFIIKDLMTSNIYRGTALIRRCPIVL